MFFVASSKLSVMSVDKETMTSAVDSVVDLGSAKVVGMLRNDSGTAISVWTLDSTGNPKALVRKTLRKKLFGSAWVLN